MKITGKSIPHFKLEEAVDQEREAHIRAGGYLVCAA